MIRKKVRYEYFSCREELNKFLDETPEIKRNIKIIYDGDRKWAIECEEDILWFINQDYYQGDGNVA